MKERKTASEAVTIFLSAARYIRKHGWQKKGMGKHGHPRCSMGALASAHPNEEWDRNLSNLMYQTLYKELDGVSLTQFNYKFDDGEKVAQLYERVAMSLARQG